MYVNIYIGKARIEGKQSSPSNFSVESLPLLVFQKVKINWKKIIFKEHINVFAQHLFFSYSVCFAITFAYMSINN